MQEQIQRRVTLAREYVQRELDTAEQQAGYMGEIARRRSVGGDVAGALSAQLDAAKLEGRCEGLRVARSQLNLIERED